jgi:NAD(P)-dependent dehydrogenase (short-subunit alcohol dehydrogenase family)
MTQTAVITGGAGGMGLAAVRIMGRDHRVVVADLNRKPLDAAVAELQGLRINVAAAVCDVTDRHSVDALLAQAEQRGHVRAVIHTAGVVNPQMVPALSSIATPCRQGVATTG